MIVSPDFVVYLFFIMILGIIGREGMRILQGGWKSTTWSRRALSSSHDDAMKEHQRHRERRQRKSNAF